MALKNQPKNESENKSGSFIVNTVKNKNALIIIAAAVTVMIAAVAVAVLFPRAEPAEPGFEQFQSFFTVEYTASIDDPLIPILDIRIDMHITELSGLASILLWRGNVSSPLTLCVDDSGADVPFIEFGDRIMIGPISPEANTVTIKYAVRFGELLSDSHNTAFTAGAMYPDLLVFAGKDALMIPILNPDPSEVLSEDFTEFVGSLTFRLETDNDWEGIMPFVPGPTRNLTFTINNPSHGDMNAFSESSFCFGHFQRFPIGESNFYIDKGALDTFRQISLEVYRAFESFYSSLFHGGLEIPFVLLRNNSDAQESMIFGGVGAGSAALSANPRFGNDCRIISMTMFRAFFDSKVPAMVLKYPPNLWLYSGLAEYYVAMSAEILPPHIREHFEIGAVESMAEKYMRYLYFSLKEPGFLTVNMSMEGEMGITLDEYYRSTKVPLLIDAINYIAWTLNGVPDSLLRTLVLVSRSGEEIDVELIIRRLVGEKIEAVKGYIAGTLLIPNYRGLRLEDYLSPAQILRSLTETDLAYSHWFELEGIYYPVLPKFLLDTERFMQAARERNVSFNTEPIQELVYDFSPVIHQLLMQHAYRAALVMGEYDITRPNIRRALYEEEAIAKWREFCERIGFLYY